MAVRYELAVGLNKGFKTTKIRRVNYKGDKKVKGLKGSSVKNVSAMKKTQVLCTKKRTLISVLCSRITSTHNSQVVIYFFVCVDVIPK